MGAWSFRIGLSRPNIFMSTWEVELSDIRLGPSAGWWQPCARQFHAPGFFVAAHDPATRFHTVRVGLNYHFNLFTPAPVIAKY